MATGEPVVDVEIEAETPQQPGVKRCWVEHYLIKDDAGSVVGVGVVCERRSTGASGRGIWLSRACFLTGTQEPVRRDLEHRAAVGVHDAVQPFAKIIGGRIEALGRAHDVRPADSDHDGVARSARSLHNLIKAILEPWPRTASASTSRELTRRSASRRRRRSPWRSTNAPRTVKYGALSTAEGSVEIARRTAGGTFELVWRERGGPPRSTSRPSARASGPPWRAAASPASSAAPTPNGAGGLTLRITALAEHLAK